MGSIDRQTSELSPSFYSCVASEVRSHCFLPPCVHTMDFHGIRLDGGKGGIGGRKGEVSCVRRKPSSLGFSAVDFSLLSFLFFYRGERASRRTCGEGLIGRNGRERDDGDKFPE